MRTNIKWSHIDQSDSVRDYLDKKLKDLDKLVDSAEGEASAQVELGKTTSHHKSGDIFRAEINLMMNGKRLRAVSETADIYSSIDEVRDEIFEEVIKQKDRRRSLIRRGGHRIKNMMRGVFGRNKN